MKEEIKKLSWQKGCFCCCIIVIFHHTSVVYFSSLICNSRKKFSLFLGWKLGTSLQKEFITARKTGTNHSLGGKSMENEHWVKNVKSLLLVTLTVMALDKALK